MARAPNAVDFWRGFALLSIFVNHIPGNVYAALTHRNVSFSDSADLFVFLAGWALRIVIEKTGGEHGPFRPIALRLLARVWKIYAAQLVTVFLAIAILATAALATGDANYYQWNGAGPVFEDPARAHIGLVLLTYHLNLFDILPLYVVLTLMAVGFVAIDRARPNLLLPASLALYLVTLLFGLQPPTWPRHDVPWIFNPFAWQLIFVLGFTLACPSHPAGAFARAHLARLRLLALPLLVVLAVMAWFHLWPGTDRLPLLLALERSYATPIRIVQFLALIAVFSAAYRFIEPAAPRLVAFLSRLGRNSLYVFCVASILSLIGLIFRVSLGGSFALDTATTAIGVFFMWLTAWLAEAGKNGKKVMPSERV
ncbi:OpgC domain-containing protein [Afifella sp. IM 167]|uniref:OpgC family protein n=1 Tax=Afifella sp. IM 167 TaxID=2033586 RepID=UPI001CCBA916